MNILIPHNWLLEHLDTKASSKEMLFSGVIGCGSELSSARELRSEGAFNQAWSNALFIELMHELNVD
jgi:GH15 family glucan-1,4-alpha-glucosidase